ncbi:MAG: nucleotidyltransferase domain-containing protein [Candidatus Nanoarchaeia archaeon]
MLNPYRVHEHVYDKDEHELAKRFAKELQKELNVFLKEVIFFGSSARKTTQEQLYERDIDVLILIDDLQKVLSNELAEAYRIITENTARRISTRFHINTLKVSAFWEYVSNGDPISINILREGQPLLEAGFFRPLQALLEQGHIRPSKENVWVYFLKAPQTLEGARWHVLQATIDLYWAALDATHAALLTLNMSPKHPGDALTLQANVLMKEHNFPREFHKLLKTLDASKDGISKRDIKHISGDEYDNLYSQTGKYVRFVQKWIGQMKQIERLKA